MRSNQILDAGEHQVQFRFQYDGGGAGNGGQGQLFLNGVLVGSQYIPRTTPYIFSANETMDVGRDRGTPVTEEYCEGKRNAFTGTIQSVRIDLSGRNLDASTRGSVRATLGVH